MNWSIDSIPFHSTTHSNPIYSFPPPRLFHVLRNTFSSDFLFFILNFKIHISYFIFCFLFLLLQTNWIPFDPNFVSFYFHFFYFVFLYFIELYELVALSHNRKGTERIGKEKKGMETNGKKSKAKDRRNEQNSKFKTTQITNNVLTLFFV